MPYRVSGKCVEVKRNDEWETLKCHDTHEEALVHHRALMSNVEEAKVGRVLSSANEREIRAALTSLIAVLERAGIDLESDKHMNLSRQAKALIEVLKQEPPPPPQDGEEQPQEAATIDPAVAQQIIDSFNQFAADLNALGIVEAAQGGEQPPTEDEPAEEADQEQPSDETPEEELDEDGKPKKKPPMKAVKKQYWFEQSEVSYIPDATGETHCASCRWFEPVSEFGGSNCHIVMAHPDPILPTGYCDQHKPVPQHEMMPMQVEIVEASAAFNGGNDTITFHGEPKVSFGSNLKGTVLSWFKGEPPKPDDSPFQVVKGSDGKYYWLARHTNNLEDRDKEILTAAAHERYVERVDKGLIDPPELWAWHQKGTRHGQADLVWTYRPKDHPEYCYVFAIGHFDDTPAGRRAAKAYARRKGQIELSHGFFYPSWALDEDGHYADYNSFEVTTLPAEEKAASNPYTSFEEILKMALTDKKRQFIKELIGDEGLETVERAQTNADAQAKELTANDVRYKDFADAIQDKGTDTMQVDLKAVLKVVADLIDAQGQTDELVDTVKALVTELAATKQKVADLETVKDKRPRSSARATETKIEGDSVLAEALKKVNEGDTYVHPVFGKMKGNG